MGIEINIPQQTIYGSAFGYSNYSKFSQSFIGGFDLDNVACHFSVGAGVVGNIIMNVYLGAYPTGGSLGTATADGNTVTAVYPSSNIRYFTFDPVITLTAATTYCFSLELSTEDYPDHYIYIIQTSISTYADGQVYWYQDITPEWVSKSTYDIVSILRSSNLPGKPTNPTPGHTDTEVDFSGFTLSWNSGGNTDTYNVWIGDSGNLYLAYEGHTETNYTSNYDEYITNGDFSDWSYDEPDNWNIDGGFFTDVLQVGDNEGHEEAIQDDSGNGLCNIYNGYIFNDTVDVYQYVTLEIGKRYALSIEINKVVTGELTIWAGVNGVDLDKTVSSVATHSWTFRATSETELIAIKSLAKTDITIDNVSVKLDEIPYDEIVYWRIDAVNESGTTEGDVWTFDPRPGQVSTFTPLNTATDLTLSEVESTWVSPSANTDSYDIYFGLESGNLTLVDNTVGLLLDLVSVFPTYNYTYYWNIDAVNDFGVTSGNEVSFTTIAFYPPLPTGVTLDNDGNPTGTPTGINNMITVRRLVVAANSKIWYESI